MVMANGVKGEREGETGMEGGERELGRKGGSGEPEGGRRCDSGWKFSI